jgi:hypothetical protein
VADDLSVIKEAPLSEADAHLTSFFQFVEMCGQERIENVSDEVSFSL